jgi:hypothetical protein
MLDKIKHLLGIAKPGGVDDVAVRAVKTAAAAFAAFVLQAGVANITDAEVAAAAVDAAWVAGATIVLNALLALAPSE